MDDNPLFAEYPLSVRQRFEAFHQANPHIYREFERLAFQMKATGRKRYSARTITEVMRWHYDLTTVGDVFELNDNFVPIYVRLLIHHHPEFLSFFELRVVRSKGIKSAEQRRRESEPQGAAADAITLLRGLVTVEPEPAGGWILDVARLADYIERWVLPDIEDDGSPEAADRRRKAAAYIDLVEALERVHTDTKDEAETAIGTIIARFV